MPWHEWEIDDGELESEDELVGATNEAWEEVRAEAEEEFERERDTLIAIAQRNITKIPVASPHHIPPSVEEIEEPASTEQDASTSRASRNGRVIRRPRNLRDFDL